MIIIGLGIVAALLAVSIFLAGQLLHYAKVNRAGTLKTDADYQRTIDADLRTQRMVCGLYAAHRFLLPPDCR